MKVAFLIIMGILSCECSRKNILEKAKKFATKKFKGSFDLSEKDFDVFDHFKRKFGKHYNRNEDDEGKGLAMVAFHEKLMEKQNKKRMSGKSKFKVGLWEYSDMSAQEIKTSMTGLILRAKPKSVYENHFPETVPDYLNYVEQGWVTNVMNQGFCGCCWAISALGAIEGQMAKKTGKLVKLSEQSLIDCNKDEEEGNWGCNGGDMVNVYDYIKSKSRGINAATYYRYKGNGEFKCQYNPEKSIGTIKDYGRVEDGNETLLMQALSHVGPLAVAVDVSTETFQNYQGGVYDDPECGQDVNHAVLLVGYGTDPEYGEYWLVKNSWGKTYGEDGFIRIARNRGNLCGIANDITYPIV